jgi:tetratricopeptide (TPR) repeat protein
MWAVCCLLLGLTALMLPSLAGSIYFVKGNLYLKTGRYREAAASYRRTTQLKPNFARAYIDLGDAYLHLKRNEEAARAFTDAIRLREDACAYCGLGWAEFNLDHRAEALSHFERAIIVNPSDSCAYKGLGRSHYDVGQYGQAAAAYSRSLALEPADAETRYALGLSYVGQGNRQAAFEQAEQLKSSSPALALKLRELLERRGRVSASVDRRFPARAAAKPSLPVDENE